MNKNHNVLCIMYITDNKRLSVSLNLPLFDSKQTNQYNEQLEYAVCTRALASQLIEGDFKALKVIQLTSAGYDGVNVKKAAEKGIKIANAANVYNVGMAEFVVYAMLLSAKRYNKSIKNHKIRLMRNYKYISELAGKTVGIMGAGNIGCQIAKRLAAFDMTVIGYDMQAFERPGFSRIYDPSSSKEFFNSCDYLVNCVPLMPSTEGMLNKSVFELLKPTVTVVNVGRKKLINDEDFLTFLKANPNATAVLDMFEKLPNPISNPYRRLSNVLVLPGVTAISQEINKKLENLVRDNMQRYQQSQPLLNIIN